MPLRRLSPSALMLLVLVLPLAACSDDDDDDASPEEQMTHSLVNLASEGFELWAKRYCDCEFEASSSNHKSCMEMAETNLDNVRDEARADAVSDCERAALEAPGASEVADCHSDYMDTLSSRAVACIESLTCNELSAEEPEQPGQCLADSALALFDEHGLPGNLDADDMTIAQAFCPDLSPQAIAIITAMDACNEDDE